MIQFHTGLEALKHPTVWAGISGALASVATSVAGHTQTALLGASGACSVVAIVLKSPDTTQIEQNKEDIKDLTQ